ncbi:hypothetical protein [Mycobacteroides abscessus]|uniref:hypothetical protein n=1 Tax=Mycobacteroides abscessus TaxID=36809 RepID=UPI0005E67057|nr:hypothetical protein [Mycobacteroides abscessus]CPR57358.1 Uncharacterised protein [Mycobacteroides abscessus]CPR57361.1 Uncharacterised protein [Mycobacteroides abscessus]CPS21817.1 Uncharacterised protein [Mycobacteroides abscessus]CPU80270.1 Uncharacterised protein [Mycobacteroides abscessus]
MTETPDLTLRQWFGKLIRGQHHLAIGGEDDPYLLRWYLIPRNKRLNIYLHQFIRSDDDRALHDHPWWFWSFVLAGHYYEHRADGRRIKRHWASIAYRAAKTRHRVELPKSNDPMSLLEREDCCWTIVVTGPRTRDWGFWVPRRPIHHHRAGRNQHPRRRPVHPAHRLGRRRMRRTIHRHIPRSHTNLEAGARP